MITVGIDEVGRGCWAGPLVAAAVILPVNFSLNHPELLEPLKSLKDGPREPIVLRDSKQMSNRQRVAAAEYIQQHALSVGLGWAWPNEIDRYGMSWSVKKAMERALLGVQGAYDELIVDGNINYFPDNPKAKAIIKADVSIMSVSAASVIAKVARDTYMTEISQKHPAYGFEKHVGYGTADHLAALRLHGVCELHRTSYKPIQAIMERAS